GGGWGCVGARGVAGFVHVRRHYQGLVLVQVDRDDVVVVLVPDVRQALLQEHRVALPELQEAGVTARVLEDQVGDVHALMVGRHELEGLERAVGHRAHLGADPERDRGAGAPGATGAVGGGRAGRGRAGTTGLLTAAATA